MTSQGLFVPGVFGDSTIEIGNIPRKFGAEALEAYFTERFCQGNPNQMKNLTVVYEIGKLGRAYLTFYSASKYQEVLGKRDAILADLNARSGHVITLAPAINLSDDLNFLRSEESMSNVELRRHETELQATKTELHVTRADLDASRQLVLALQQNVDTQHQFISSLKEDVARFGRQASSLNEEVSTLRHAIDAAETCHMEAIKCQSCKQRIVDRVIECGHCFCKPCAVANSTGECPTCKVKFSLTKDHKQKVRSKVIPPCSNWHISSI